MFLMINIVKYNKDILFSRLWVKIMREKKSVEEYGELKNREFNELNKIMYEAKENKENQIGVFVERGKGEQECNIEGLSQYRSFQEYCDRENRYSEILALKQYQSTYEIKDWGKGYLEFCEIKDRVFKFGDLLDEWRRYEITGNYKEAIKAECAYLFCFVCNNMIEGGKNIEDAICEVWEGVLYHLLIVHQWMIIWMEYRNRSKKMDADTLQSLQERVDAAQKILKYRNNDIQYEVSMFERITGLKDKEMGSLSVCEANALSAIMEAVIEEEYEDIKGNKSKSGFYFAASEINNKKENIDNSCLLYEIQKKEYYGSMYSNNLQKKMSVSENEVDDVIALDRFRGNYSVGAIVYAMDKIGLIKQDKSSEMRKRTGMLSKGLMDLWKQGQEIKELSGFLVGYMLLLIDKVLDCNNENTYTNFCVMLLGKEVKGAKEKNLIKNLLYNGLCKALGKIKLQGLYIGLSNTWWEISGQNKETFDNVFQKSQMEVNSKDFEEEKVQDFYSRLMILYEIYRWK